MRRRNSRESTRTGKKKVFRQDIQRCPSGEMPPPGTMQCTCVSFKWKDYRRNGQARYGVMTLDAHEFIRRFLLHVLPDGFHRIRHYGLFANGGRVENLAKARALLADAAHAAPTQSTAPAEPTTPMPCPCCGGRMMLVEVFGRGDVPRAWSCPPTPQWCDTS
jgi:hypothetical protein